MTTRSDAEFAELERTIAELRRDLADSRSAYAERTAQQAATLDVLQAMSASPGDAQPVFDAIARRAREFCQADGSGIVLLEAGQLHLRGYAGFTETAGRAYEAAFPRPVDNTTVIGRSILARDAVYIPDLMADPHYALTSVAAVSAQGSSAAVPFSRDGVPIGAIAIGRFTVGAFSDAQMELLRTFAQQAVIAITSAETYRALQDSTASLREALERQTATAEVLGVINASPGDLTPVFEAILEKAHALCGAEIGTLTRYDGEFMRALAVRGLPAEQAAFVMQPFRPSPGGGIQRLIDGARFSQMADMATEHVPGQSETFAKRTGLRTYLGIPLRKDGAFVGQISAYRREVRPFAEKEIALLENFAAQAVIAMENARLLDELRARTGELAERNSAYGERIEHQAATIDVLKAMSASPGDPQPVFDLIAQRARDICGGYGVSVFEYDGALMHLRAYTGVSENPAVRAEYEGRFPMPPPPDVPSGRAILDGRTVQIDIASGTVTRSVARDGTVKSGMGVPMLRGQTVIGALGMGSQESGGFSDTQIELLRTFAEQAVIAITSAETYRALQTRTTDLQESLEYQTAISDVLKVISRSTFDLQPVLDSIMETAARICDADMAFIFRRHGDIYKLESNWGFPPEFAAYLKTQALAPGRASITQRTALEGRIIHVHDMAADPEYALPKWEMAGVRTGLGVPLTRDGVMVGVIDLARRGVRPFSERQIELVATFADQAVIAIENTRLLTEQREALDQQTATAEILRVINASPGDLAPVFDTILAKAHALCGAELGSLAVFDGQFFRKVARYGYESAADEFLSKPYPPLPIHAPFFKGETVHIADFQDPALLDPRAGTGVDNFRSSRLRTWLEVPLWKDGTLLGTISGWRREPRPFADKEIRLLQNFADQAVLAMENARLLTEQREALERQTAMADLLAVINASPGDPQPVFDAILQKAHDLCDAESGALTLCDEQNMWCIATLGLPEEFAARLRQPFASTFIRAWNEGMRYLHIPDLRAVDWPEENWVNRGLVRYTNARTRLIVPMRKDGRLIGLVSANRPDVRAFVEQEISLLESFAAQAVIAMENARLLREQREALERQTATAEVLRVINENPGNLVPVFDAMLEKAALLCDADCGSFFVIDDDTVQAVVTRGLPAEYHAELTTKGAVGPQSGVARVARGEDVVHLPDMRLGPSYLAGEPFTVRTVDVFGLRTWLGVPLRKDGVALGLLAVARFEVRPFTDRQIDLLKSFAAQAVIAMENARLLEELREALERQTATAEVVGIINASPGDLAPVFDAMLERALRLSGVAFGIMHRYDGEFFQVVATLGVPPAFEAFRRQHPIPISPETPPGQAILTGRSVQVPDVATDPFFAARPELRDTQLNLGGIRAVLNVPMIKDGQPVGMFVVYREEPGAFPDKQVALLENFAAQAVIAMENARLLTEQREALERQTAMAEVLQVINASPGNLTPVFDSILDRAHAICGAVMGSLFVYEDGKCRSVATHGVPDAFVARLRQPFPPSRGYLALIRGDRFVHVPDIRGVWSDTGSEGDTPTRREQMAMLRNLDARTLLLVPMRKDTAVVGFISAYRTEVRPFAESEIALLENFAAQAVIAMDNARLLNEIRQRQSELNITFENMGDGVAMFDDAQKLVAWNRNFQDILDLPDDAVRLGLPFADYIRGLAESGEYGPDANADEQIARLTALLGQANRFERIRPNGRVIDIRQNPIPDGGFVIIYADITERKRAEEALRAARDDAETALRDLKVAQASLVQAEKMASLGQLTAGIAHEIKNPLNFVNNFAALSVELLDELKEVTAPALAMLDDDARADAGDLTATLTSNLHKIEEHGKRADNIVRGMLEHSRASAGERRAVDLNELVEEALNLAYHGARARDQNFNITLERDYAAGIAPIEVAPQDLTRVFLNLFGNGFDAARARQKMAPAGFEPTLRASTSDHGDSVEIRVRDNGTGVPPEIRDKLFQPFFTTKPAGEGTGLGLSISYDIVTQQHGGSIVLDSAPNVFTEFTVTIPRGMASGQGGTP